MDEGRRPTGRTNPFWLLAGGYLIYLAYQLFRGLWRGEATMPVLNVTGGLVFIGVGCWLFWREWKAYKYGLEHKDDPATWSDAPLEEAPDAPEDGEEEET